MSGSWALDTNSFIAAVNGVPSVLSILEEADSIYLPITVLGEMLFGAVNSARPEENIATVNEFVSDCTVLAADAPAAWRYARFARHSGGRGVRCRKATSGSRRYASQTTFHFCHPTLTSIMFRG